MSKKAHKAVPGNSSVQFVLPAFKDGSNLIIEMKAFMEGPRGGKSTQMDLSDEYWTGLIEKLAKVSVSTA